MNLKEAFRFQNKIQNLMTEAEVILNRDKNVTRVENTALRHKVNPEAEDETTIEMPDTEYAEQINEVVVFLMFLLSERRNSRSQAGHGHRLRWRGKPERQTAANCWHLPPYG